MPENLIELIAQDIFVFINNNLIKERSFLIFYQRHLKQYNFRALGEAFKRVYDALTIDPDYYSSEALNNLLDIEIFVAKRKSKYFILESASSFQETELFIRKIVKLIILRDFKSARLVLKRFRVDFNLAEVSSNYICSLSLEGCNFLLDNGYKFNHNSLPEFIDVSQVNLKTLNKALYQMLRLDLRSETLFFYVLELALILTNVDVVSRLIRYYCNFRIHSFPAIRSEYIEQNYKSFLLTRYDYLSCLVYLVDLGFFLYSEKTDQEKESINFIHSFGTLSLGYKLVAPFLKKAGFSQEFLGDLYDIDQDEPEIMVDQFNVAPPKLGVDYSTISTCGNGNCFFESIGILLNLSPQEIRERMLEQLSQVKEYKPYFLATSFDEYLQQASRASSMNISYADNNYFQEFRDGLFTFERYLDYIGRDGAWADNIAIQAVADAFNIRIIIHEPEVSNTIIISPSRDGFFSFLTLNILYENQNHFVPMIFNDFENSSTQNYDELYDDIYLFGKADEFY